MSNLQVSAKHLINEAIDRYCTRKFMNLSLVTNSSHNKEIAKGAGITHASLLNWIHGRTEPKYGDLLAVLNFCGMDLELIVKPRQARRTNEKRNHEYRKSDT